MVSLRDQTIKQLRDEIAVLKRTLEEARAELDDERSTLISRVQTLVALLREVEWCVNDSCPLCLGHPKMITFVGGRRIEPGHAPDCRIAAVLEGLTSRRWCAVSVNTCRPQKQAGTHC